MQIKLKNEKGETLKAGCIVTNDKEEILLVKHHESFWSFPKGHSEDGETLEQVAVRETLEETGYEVAIVRRLSDHVYMNYEIDEPIRVAYFLAEIVRKTDRQPDEEYEWIAIQKAKEIVFPNLVKYFDEI